MSIPSSQALQRVRLNLATTTTPRTPPQQQLSVQPQPPELKIDVLSETRGATRERARGVYSAGEECIIIASSFLSQSDSQEMMIFEINVEMI